MTLLGHLVRLVAVGADESLLAGLGNGEQLQKDEPSGAWAIKRGSVGHSVPDDSSKSVSNKVSCLLKPPRVLPDL